MSLINNAPNWNKIGIEVEYWSPHVTEAVELPIFIVEWNTRVTIYPTLVVF